MNANMLFSSTYLCTLYGMNANMLFSSTYLCTLYGMTAKHHITTKYQFEILEKVLARFLEKSTEKMKR
jgi:hypothetical protein